MNKWIKQHTGCTMLKLCYEKTPRSMIYSCSFIMFYAEYWLVNELRARWWDGVSIREIWTSPHLLVITGRQTRGAPMRSPSCRCFNFAASDRGVGRALSGLISPWHAMLHGHPSDDVTARGDREGGIIAMHNGNYVLHRSPSVLQNLWWQKWE
jgi:hypothetical protein